MTVFDHYAAYYDLFYEGKEYGPEARYVAAKLAQSMPGARSILELGCGTAGHAVELIRAGYSVTGVDLSESMLVYAGAKRRTLTQQEQARMELVHGDARSVRLGRTFDAVLALFHVMSYQSSNDDLLAAFRTAADHLPAGGVFLFDFWYGPAVLSQRPETRVHDLENGAVRVTRIARPLLRENANAVDVRFTVLIEEKATGGVSRLEETHVMRYLFLPEIDWLLAASGLRRLCANAWLASDEPSAESWSAWVVAQKPGIPE